MHRGSVDYDDTSVDTLLAKVSESQSQPTQSRYVSKAC